jgi:hypothetical protein
MIVACDLDRDSQGRVVVGRETKIACDRAIQLASADLSNSVIIATAGRASFKWSYAWMAKAIEDYVFSLRSRDSVRFIAEKADTFNTSGEMKCLAHHVVMQNAGKDQIVLAVKWWHAPRSKFLCRYWLKRFGVGYIPISISACPSHVGWITILGEFLGAWPKNILRMAFSKL